jgi:hypothetical protein
MATRISVAAQNAAANAVVGILNTGTGNGVIRIRTGTEPATLATASSGTLLATPTFAATAFGSASNGVATAAAITSDTNAAASGDAGYFRCYAGAAGDTAGVIQGKAGVSGDTPEMTFDNKSIVAGGTVAISSMTYTQPSGA